MRRAVWIGVLCGAMASACGGGEPADPGAEPAAVPTPPPPPSVPEPPPLPPPPTGADAVRAVMRGHYGRVRSAHDALIRADMDQARDDMAWLATHEEGDALPENLQPLLAAMQAEAGRFAAAATLTEAGTTFARMLTRCGACHLESHGGPAIAEVAIPEGETPEARMRRHRWASDRMFDGLITGSADMFRSGNVALSSGPMTREDLPATAALHADQVLALTTHVRDLGGEAAGAADDEARASIYGRYLATCGSCHRLLEGGLPEGLRPAAEAAPAVPREAAILTPPGTPPAE